MQTAECRMQKSEGEAKSKRVNLMTKTRACAAVN